MFNVLCSTLKVENTSVIPAWFSPESSTAVFHSWSGHAAGSILFPKCSEKKDSTRRRLKQHETLEQMSRVKI